MKPSKNLLIYLLLLSSLFSCKNCEDQSEPEATLQFHNSAILYEKAQGIGSDQIIYGPFEYQSFPLSIISDTTSFIFHSEASVDTLAISYKRNFVFESNECGFTVTLSDFKNLKATTFDSIAFNVNQSTDLQLIERNKNEYFISIYN